MTHVGGRGRVRETDVARVRVGQGMAGQNYCVVLMVVIIHLLAYEDETDRVFRNVGT
jgi:hypothetical protein